MEREVASQEGLMYSKTKGNLKAAACVSRGSIGPGKHETQPNVVVNMFSKFLRGDRMY